MNQSSTSLEVEWNTTLPAFLTYGDEKRGFKIDFQRAGDTEVKSILVCNSSSYLFSDLMVFTNYCSSVVSFNNDKIDTKVDNFKCVFTDEEGNNNICIHPCFIHPFFFEIPLCLQAHVHIRHVQIQIKGNFSCLLLKKN